MDKNSKIKALFFDIDGTLVSFQTHRIPQSTVEALEKAKQNGVKIYISTGRTIILITNLGQIEHLIDGSPLFPSSSNIIIALATSVT